MRTNVVRGCKDARGFPKSVPNRGTVPGSKWEDLNNERNNLNQKRLTLSFGAVTCPKLILLEFLFF